MDRLYTLHALCCSYVVYPKTLIYILIRDLQEDYTDVKYYELLVKLETIYSHLISCTNYNLLDIINNEP